MALVLVALRPPIAAQPPCPGHRIYQTNGSSVVRLVDDIGAIVHEWPTTPMAEGCIALHTDGTLFRSRDVQPSRGVERLAFDGTQLWAYESEPGRSVHHDIEVLPNGNVLLIAAESWTREEAIAEGRNPAQQPGAFISDSVIEVQPTGPTSGMIVWEWHARDHVIQDFDPGMANFGVVAEHPELLDINFPASLKFGEFNHANGIDYDPIHDWVAISSPVQNEVWIIDHGTTSQEAASSTGGRWGKGGDVLYRWGNPQAYRAGTPGAQQLFWQHDPRFVAPGYPGAGNLTVFNNQLLPGQSAVFELVLPLDASGNFLLTPGSAYGPAGPVWLYTAAGFYSQIMSGAERLPNGNTLICSATQDWIFEVTPAGTTVWEHRGSPRGGIFHAHHTPRSLWANREAVVAAAGAAVRFDLETGSMNAGSSYVMLGSASGTAPGFTLHGVAVPLNADGYFTTLLASVGSGAFANWVGTLDPSGGVSASYVLPPIPPLAGLTLNHAMLVIPRRRLLLASNAVPLVFQP